MNCDFLVVITELSYTFRADMETESRMFSWNAILLYQVRL